MDNERRDGRETVCKPWNSRVCFPTSCFQPVQLLFPCKYQQDSTSNPREHQLSKSGSTFPHGSKTNHQNVIRPTSPLPRKEYQDTTTARAPTAVPYTVILAGPLPVLTVHGALELTSILYTPQHSLPRKQEISTCIPGRRVSRMLLRRREPIFGVRNFSPRSQRLDEQDHRRHYQWLVKRNRL